MWSGGIHGIEYVSVRVYVCVCVCVYVEWRKGFLGK